MTTTSAPPRRGCTAAHAATTADSRAMAHTRRAAPAARRRAVSVPASSRTAGSSTIRNGTSMSQTMQVVPRGQRSNTSSVVVNLTAAARPAGRARRSETAAAVLPARLQAPEMEMRVMRALAAILYRPRSPASSRPGQGPGGRVAARPEPARLRAVRRSRLPGVLATRALVWPLASCATGGVKSDLDPARTAVAEARQAGAPTRSAEAFTRAEKHLQEAEALEAGRNGRRDRRGAQRAADLAIVEAHCATALSRALRPTEQTTTKAAAQGAASPAERDRLTPRIKESEADQHRLEERVAVLTRDLEGTETEPIPPKAPPTSHHTHP